MAPDNGAGTFSPVHTWVDDAADEIDIEADRMDEQDEDIADALTNRLPRDGQASPTANINWGGFKITNLGDATADGDVLNRQTGDARYISTGALGDPNADRILFWDDSGGAIAYLTPSADFAFDTTNLNLASGAKPYGKQSVWIPASAMYARTTNGAASGSSETTTNKNMLKSLDFDTSTQEFAQFAIAMPASWNESTVTFQPIWSHASTVTNFGVVFSLAGVALSNDDAGDAAFGTVQTSTDTGGTTDDFYLGPESSAITIAGTPAANDLVMFQIARVPSDGSDTLGVDARLHGIFLHITTDAGHD